MDLIDRQKAIDAVNAYGWLSRDGKARCNEVLSSLPSATEETFEWCNGCKEYDQSAHCCHRWTKVIRNTVEEIRNEQRWIPVSERLPEKSGKYLVTVQNGNVYAGTFDAYSGRFQCAAVAWQPLPEPYKDGN